MKVLTTGQFHGQTNKIHTLDGITLTDTEYTQAKVDWHYHETAYFTFILQGQVLEGNKKEIYTCTPSSLLFHHWQEPHYNIKPEGYTRGFHIEIEKQWFEKYDLRDHHLEGSFNISSPEIKLLLYKIFGESKQLDVASILSIECLLLQGLSELNHQQKNITSKKPLWVEKLRAILQEESNRNLSLHSLVQTLDIHPVHLSRCFPKYFNCTLGEYIRKVRIEKAISLLPIKKYSLTEIAFECGFADQSHFTRNFKELVGFNPLAYRRILLS